MIRISAPTLTASALAWVWKQKKIRAASLAAQALSLHSRSGVNRTDILAAAQSLLHRSERRGKAYLCSFTVALSLFILIHKLLSFFVLRTDFYSAALHLFCFFSPFAFSLLSVRLFLPPSLTFLPLLLLILCCIDSLCVYSQLPRMWKFFVWSVKLKLRKIHMLIHQFVRDYCWFRSKSEKARLGLPMKNM